MDDNEIKPSPFVDWCGIWPGHGGVGPDGLSWIQDPPVGDLQLKIQPGRWSEPFLHEREHPWEKESLIPLMVLREGDRLRAWYHCTGDNGIQYDAYAESEDGMSWEKPELGLVEYDGSTANNLLHPRTHFAIRSLFIDPTAAPEERYKAVRVAGRYFVDGKLDLDMSFDQFAEMRNAMQHEGFTADEAAQKVEIRQTIFGAVSPDGLRWTPLEEPLRDLGSRTLDGEYYVIYDEDKGEYVAYHRGHLERRRAVRRSTGKSFDEWSEPQFVFMPDGQDPIDADVYGSGYVRYPGKVAGASGTGGGHPAGGDTSDNGGIYSGRLHLMFLPFYHRTTSTVDVQLATSRDGLLWSRPERVPIIERGEYECVYSRRDLVALTDEEWGLPFQGTHHRHDFKTYDSDNDPYQAETSSIEWRWALWKRDRLVALEAQAEARFTMVQRKCSGTEMRLNYETEKGGWVRIELVEPPVTPPTPVEAFPGYGLDDADPLVGDELSRVVTWDGRSDLSELKGQNVSIRIHMARARLYSLFI